MKASVFEWIVQVVSSLIRYNETTGPAADMNDISEDEVTFSNIICPDCVLVKVDRNIFDVI